MQLRLKPKTYRNTASRNLIVKAVLFFVILFVAIFLLGKLDLPVPSKVIKQQISDDKLITLK